MHSARPRCNRFTERSYKHAYGRQVHSRACHRASGILSLFLSLALLLLSFSFVLYHLRLRAPLLSSRSLPKHVIPKTSCHTGVSHSAAFFLEGERNRAVSTRLSGWRRPHLSAAAASLSLSPSRFSGPGEKLRTILLLLLLVIAREYRRDERTRGEPDSKGGTRRKTQRNIHRDNRVSRVSRTGIRLQKRLIW